MDGKVADFVQFRSDMSMLIIGTEASTTKGKPKPVQTATAAVSRPLCSGKHLTCLAACRATRDEKGLRCSGIGGHEKCR
jgi:hypothetical protein